MRSSVRSRCTRPCTTRRHASPSCCVTRSDAVVASNTTGSDHGWLLRLSLGSGTGGTTSPRRLKPGTLGCDRWLVSTSPSTSVRVDTRQSPASASTRRSPRGVAHDRIDVLGARVEPKAERIGDAEALAQVDRSDDAAALAPLEEGRAQRRLERSLDDEVDEAARRARAGLDAAGALEDVDACLVLQRDRRLGVDRQPVAAIVEAVVDDESADGGSSRCSPRCRRPRSPTDRSARGPRDDARRRRGSAPRRSSSPRAAPGRAARRPSPRRSPAPAPCR